MFKSLYKKALFLLFCIQLPAQAFEIRPFGEFLFGSDVHIKKEAPNSSRSHDWNTDPLFEIGSEFLFTPQNLPLRYGFGTAYKSPQKSGSDIATPATIPLWLSFSVGWFKGNTIAPYAVTRFGTLAPLTDDGNWWEKPLNFFGNAGLGVILPYHIGLEVNYDYSSMLKNFDNVSTKYRVSSGRVGIQLSIGFSFGQKKPVPEATDSTLNKDSYTVESVPNTENDSSVTKTDSATTEATPDTTTDTVPSFNSYETVQDSAPATADSITDTISDTTAAISETAVDSVAVPVPVEPKKEVAPKKSKNSAKKSTSKKAKKATKKQKTSKKKSSVKNKKKVKKR